MKYNVILVDDHPILTDGLKIMIDKDPDFQVVGVFSQANFALSFLKSYTQVDLIILDQSMGEISGIDLVKNLKICHPSLKIMMLTMHDEPHLVKEAIAAGVDGYVLKKSASTELLLGMHALIEGRSFWSAEVGQLLFKSAKQNEYSEDFLTNRELEVLNLIVQELTNKEIANKLFISERTVEVHRKNMMRKAKVSNTVGLIKYALSKGLK